MSKNNPIVGQFFDTWYSRFQGSGIEGCFGSTGFDADSERSSSGLFTASGCGDTAHEPLIHVGTPSLGRIQRFKTIQKTSTPIGSKTSIVLPLLGMAGSSTLVGHWVGLVLTIWLISHKVKFDAAGNLGS